MAKFAISQEGLDSLDKLSNDLKQVVTGIEDACKTLYTKIEGIEDGLGVYNKDILICIRDVISINKAGTASIEYLTDISIPEHRRKIEEFMYFLGETSDDDADQPPQKKLVLRRH